MAASVNLSWNDLVMRVANKVGITQPTPMQVNTILYNLIDALVEIKAIAQDIKVLDKKYAVFDGAKPSHIPNVSVNAGNCLLTPGFYSYAYSFYNSLQGETELTYFGEDTELLDNNTQAITISNLPVIPHGVESIIIYRTTVNSDVYKKHSVRTSNSAFIDNIADSSLGNTYAKPEKFADTSDLKLPDDLFVITQLRFTDISDRELLAKEATSEEEFVRIKKEKTEEAETIQNIGSEPIALNQGTFEEGLYAGNVIYTLRTVSPKSLNYKPRFNGYIYLTYTAIPEVVLDNLDDKPEVVYMFRQLLVKHATLSYLFNLLSQVPQKDLTEAQIQSLIILYRVESSNYEKMLKRYVSYTKQRVSPSFQTRLPDFLNDIKMELL